jgi:DNA-binding beta-propeller fold protein YncE
VIYDRGVLYVADTDVNLHGARILRVDPATGAVTPIAGRRDMLGAQDGTGTAALFSEPRGLSMCSGTLYVADKRGGTIRRVDPATGKVTTWVQRANTAKDGPVAAARMVAPAGTACDRDGLYVADAGAHAVRHIDFATETVSTVAGTFGRAEDHDDVLALAGTNAPLAVRIVGGKLLVMNQSNVSVIH